MRELYYNSRTERQPMPSPGSTPLTSAAIAFPTAKTVATRLWKPAVLTIYCAILAVIAFHHEPWFDEAQAWLLARDASVPDLWLRYLGYEGSPGLWHLLLMAPAKLGCPYWTMRLLAALSSTAAVAMILWLSPFPPVIRAVIPFTYFLLYQYAVVARSYALLAPLLFAIAWFLPRSRSKPWALVAFLVLLANVSVHGTLAAMGILAAYLVELWRHPESRPPGLSRRLIVSCAVFLLAVIAVGIELWPGSKTPFVQGLISNITLISQFREHLLSGTHQVAEAFSARPWAAAVPLGLSLLWLVTNGKALYFVLPAGLVLAFSSFVYAAPWHAGILYLLWLFGMWVASDRNPRNLPRYVWLAWVMVLGMHVYWAASASLRDIEAPYSGAKALAEDIAPDVAAGKRIVGKGYFLTAVQPYFPRNVLLNYHGGSGSAFWLATPANESDLNDVSPAGLVSQNPDLILVSLWSMSRDEQDQLIRSLSDSGYSFIRKFPGQTVWKAGLLTGDDYLVARKRVDP